MFFATLLLIAALLLVGAAPARADDTILASLHARWAIGYSAAVWHVDPRLMDAVARCESGTTPWAYNASSGASGLFQFMPATYRLYARALRMDMSALRWDNSWAQAWIAAADMSLWPGTVWRGVRWGGVDDWAASRWCWGPGVVYG